MAETVHLFLKLNEAEIQGESTQTSLGRENSIECLSWTWGVDKAAGAAGASGRLTMGEVKFVQRIDKSTPLLFRGLCDNQAVEGTFKFFRPNPTGDGTTEQFFTVRGTQGRLTSINEWVPDTLNPATAVLAPLVQVTMLFGSVKNTYENGGVEFEWDRVENNEGRLAPPLVN